MDRTAIMQRPLKAMVLAAGFGTRMLLLSRDLPKPLMPLWNRPILEHAVLLLKRWGVRDIAINLHHEAGALLDWARKNPVPGVSISLSFEPDILGTGGALRRAQWFLDDRPFWLINGDIAADLDPEPLLRASQARRTLAVLWLDPDRGPRTVETRDDTIAAFSARSPGRRGLCTFCGLHLVSPRILDYLPPSGFSSIIAAYEKAMRHGERVLGIRVPGAYWADLGVPRDYLEAHREALLRHRRRRPGKWLFDPAINPWAGSIQRAEDFAAVAPGARIEPGAQIRNSVVWEGALLRRDAALKDAIAGRGVEIAGPASGCLVRGDLALDLPGRKVLAAIGWPPERTSVQPLPARGSARDFFRLDFNRHRAILVRYSPIREENCLYASHARFLRRHGFPAPRVIHDDPNSCLTVFEDAGDESLQDRAIRCPAAERARLYRSVLDRVSRLHNQVAHAARRERIRLMPPFSPALYRWEREYFAEHFLRGRMKCPARVEAALCRELASVARRLEPAPPALIHRDLQSSNILLTRTGPVFIDFQGMRMGAAAYDLASLLYDPYVELDEALRSDLLGYYAELAEGNRAVPALFRWAGVQRLAQALGAYARLGAQPGLSPFQQHIAPALRLMRSALSDLPGLKALKAFFLDSPELRG